jgi:hypothetical protein
MPVVFDELDDDLVSGAILHVDEVTRKAILNRPTNQTDINLS